MVPLFDGAARCERYCRKGRPTGMRRLATAFLLILLSTWAVADEIKIYNWRPSRMLGMLALSRWDAQVFEAQYQEGGGGLIPFGVRVKADDVKGVLIAHGDPESI